MKINGFSVGEQSPHGPTPPTKKQEEGNNLMGRFHDLTGQRFGRLLVIGRAEDKTTGFSVDGAWSEFPIRRKGG